jgi:dTMP kinase
VSSSGGVLIAFEGGDGAGKSTQAARLAAWLTERGHEVVATRQPGGTPVGAAVRGILLEPATGELSPRTEALLYAADKAEHVDTVVLPALERGAVVVTDRYVDSTLAYQGAGRALTPDELQWLVDWATRRVRPALTVLLDVDADTGSERLTGLDRLEASQQSSTGASGSASGSWPRRSRRGTSSWTPALPLTRSPRRCKIACRRCSLLLQRGPRHDGVGRRRRAAGTRSAPAECGRLGTGPCRGWAGSGMTHAWLFTGPPGSGRSNAARAFAAPCSATRVVAAPATPAAPRDGRAS